MEEQNLTQSQNPSPQSIVPPLPEQPSSSNLKSPKWIVVAIIVVALILVGIASVYFLNQNSIKNKSIQIAPKLTPISSPTPTVTMTSSSAPLDTSSWKTYISGDVLKKININFSVKYPTNWFTNEENPTYTSNVPDVVISEKPVKDVMSRDSACFSVKASIFPDETIGDFVKGIDNEAVPPSTYPKIFPSENITINGMAGEKRKVIEYNETQAVWQVFLNGGANPTYGKGETTFFILESCQGTSDTTFNQILSTFKSTGQGQTGCNTDNDCQNGAKCMTIGPIIANQPLHKVCVPQGQAVPQ